MTRNMKLIKGDSGIKICLSFADRPLGKKMSTRYRIGKGKKWYNAKADNNGIFSIPKHVVKRMAKTIGYKEIEIRTKIEDSTYSDTISINTVQGVCSE